MRLIPKEFHEDVSLEEKRSKLAAEADAVFEQMLCEPKGTAWHLRLLRRFNHINGATRRLLEEHRYYFQQKRESALLHGGSPRMFAGIGGGL